mgnify:CR=1 FL=1
MEWDEFTSFIVDNGMHGAEADTYTINQCVGVAVVAAASELVLTQCTCCAAGTTLSTRTST